jgi:DNA-binding helix-hairpin-helix protein with protein kinase domain
MTLHLSTGRAVTPGRPEIGRGAQGVVYPVADSDFVCVKVYFDSGPAVRRRLQALTELAPASWAGDHADHLHVAWPRGVVLDHNDVARGFVMPRVHGAPLRRLIDPARRPDVLDEPTWRTNLTVAGRIARLVGMLHDAHLVIGDVSPGNFLVDRRGYVTLIDCDTVQFTDPKTGRAYQAEKVTPEYAAPEVLRDGPAAQTRYSDAFALAVILVELLLEGAHPYEGVPTGPGNLTGASENIRLNNNRVTRPERLVRVDGDIPVDLLPSAVQALARQCFEAGHDDPARRPSAADWERVLGQAAFQVMGCRLNARHAYPTSMPECLWCVRRRDGRGEHFPQPATPAVPLTPVVTPAPTEPVTPTVPLTPVAAPERAPAIRERATRRPPPVPVPPAAPARRRPTAPAKRPSAPVPAPATGRTWVVVVVAVVILLVMVYACFGR